MAFIEANRPRVWGAAGLEPQGSKEMGSHLLLPTDGGLKRGDRAHCLHRVVVAACLSLTLPTQIHCLLGNR